MSANPTTPNIPVDPSLASRIPVIEYHHSEFAMGKTVQMKTEWFEAQMQWLSENEFHTLTSAELVQFIYGEARPPRKSVGLRFDMGLPVLESFHDVIFPTLQKHNFHAFFFVLINALKDECKDNYVCWSQLEEWEASGLVEVQSHGVYHPNYKKLSLAGRQWDAKTSKKLIEEHLGHPISFLGFPFDAVPPRPDALLKPLGYQAAFAGYRPERSVLFKDKTPYALPTYYPYCGEKTYPVVTGTKGLTFGQMIEKAIA